MFHQDHATEETEGLLPPQETKEETFVDTRSRSRTFSASTDVPPYISKEEESKKENADNDAGGLPPLEPRPYSPPSTPIKLKKERNKDRKVAFSPASSMAIVPAQGSGSGSGERAKALISLQEALGNPYSIPSKQYDGPSIIGLQDMALLNLKRTQLAMKALQKYKIDTKHEFSSLAIIFFKALLEGKKTSASYQALPMEIGILETKARQLPNADKITFNLLDLFSEVHKIAKSFYATEPVKAKRLAACLVVIIGKSPDVLTKTYSAIVDVTVTTIGGARSLKEKLPDFSRKLTAIDNSIQQLCGQHGMTKLIFENYFINYFFDFPIFTLEIDDIPTKIEHIFHVFLEYLQLIYTNLPLSHISFWRLGHLLATQGDQLFAASSTKEITSIFLAHNAELNIKGNGRKISQEFLTQMGSTLSPIYLKKINNQTLFKDREDLEHDLELFRYTEYAEWASYLISAVIAAMIILMATKIIKSQSEAYLPLSLIGIILPVLGFLHRKYYRIEPQQEIEKTLTIYSQRGPQHFSTSALTDEQDIDNARAMAYDALSQV